MFALTRVILRYRGGIVPLTGFIFWCSIFSLAIIGVIFPGYTSNLAKFLGIGRGVDLVIYISIVLIFYLIFRIYVYVENLKREMTELIQKLALKDDNKKNDKD